MENDHSYSNCVVHDDTFDWGGPSDIMSTHESNNTSTKYNWSRRTKIQNTWVRL